MDKDWKSFRAARCPKFTNPVFSGSLWALWRYCARYGYAILCHKISRSRGYGVVELWRLQAVNPRALLRGFLSDLRTLRFRMGRRCSALPGDYVGTTLPVFERMPNAVPVPNIHSLVCIQDTGSFAACFPLATRFDWDSFQEGWHRGYEYGARMGNEERVVNQETGASRNYAPGRRT
jgi:hypothetical protein